MTTKNKFAAAMKSSAGQGSQDPKIEVGAVAAEPTLGGLKNNDEKRQVWKTPRTRKGRKGVMTYVDSDAHKALAMLAIEQEKTQQELMREALNGLFRQYGKTPIA